MITGLRNRGCIYQNKPRSPGKKRNHCGGSGLNTPTMRQHSVRSRREEKKNGEKNRSVFWERVWY